VLLHALAAARRDGYLSCDLAAIHIDHGLQPDSGSWADSCRATCRQLGVALTVEQVRVKHTLGAGPEAKARNARYAALARHLGPGEVLLTGHHQDDQAETLLLQLFRGAGIHGIASMPAVVPFGSGFLARPLLGYTRADLADYAVSNDLKWIEDPSNADLRLRRNLIRRRVLPAVREAWPEVSSVLARSATTAAQAARVVDELARLDLAACRLPGPSEALSAPALRSLPPGRLENTLRFWLRSCGQRAPDHRHLAALVRQIRTAPHTGSGVLCCPGVELRRHRDALYAPSPAPTVLADLDLPWDPHTPVDLPDLGLRLSAHRARGEGLSRERVEGRELRLRLRQGGERCRLPGRTHHHRLKKLLQARGVAPWVRQRLPLLYVDGELAAVGDLWACEPFAAVAGEEAWRLILSEI